MEDLLLGRHTLFRRFFDSLLAKIFVGLYCHNIRCRSALPSLRIGRDRIAKYCQNQAIRFSCIDRIPIPRPITGLACHNIRCTAATRNDVRSTTPTTRLHRPMFRNMGTASGPIVGTHHRLLVRTTRTRHAGVRQSLGRHVTVTGTRNGSDLMRRLRRRLRRLTWPLLKRALSDRSLAWIYTMTKTTRNVPESTLFLTYLEYKRPGSLPRDWK